MIKDEKIKNPNFNKERFGRFFDENGVLIPELEKEYLDEVRKEREEKKNLKEADESSTISIKDALRTIIDKFGNHKYKYEVRTDSFWDGRGWEGDAKYTTFYAPNDYIASFYMLLDRAPTIAAFEEYEITGDRILDYFNEYPEVEDIAYELHTGSLEGNENIVTDLTNLTTGEVLAHQDTEEAEWDEDDDYDWDDDEDLDENKKRSIKEELNLEIEDKAREVVNPAYAAAMRELKKGNERRKSKIDADLDNVKNKNFTLDKVKKIQLEESLFEDWNEIDDSRERELSVDDYLEDVKRGHGWVEVDKIQMDIENGGYHCNVQNVLNRAAEKGWKFDYRPEGLVIYAMKASVNEDADPDIIDYPSIRKIKRYVLNNEERPDDVIDWIVSSASDLGIQKEVSIIIRALSDKIKDSDK